MKFLIAIYFLMPTMALSAAYPRAIQKCAANNPAASARFHASQDAYIDKLLRLIELLRKDKSYEDQPEVVIKYATERPKHMLSAYGGIGPAGLDSKEDSNGVLVSPGIDLVGGITYHYRFWEGLSVTGGAIMSFKDPASTTFIGGLSTGW